MESTSSRINALGPPTTAQSYKVVRKILAYSVVHLGNQQFNCLIRFSGELDSSQSCTAVSNEPMLLWDTPQENWKLMPLSSSIKRKIEDPCDE